MARDAAAMIAGDGQSFTRRRMAAALALAGLALATGCSRQPELTREQLVGKWKSSRLATPLHLLANGEWEIRTEEDRVLQYGVWQLEGRKITWIVKVEGRIERDVNTILKVADRAFELREQDGSVTRFERLQ